MDVGRWNGRGSHYALSNDQRPTTNDQRPTTNDLPGGCMTSGVELGADGRPRCSWCLGDDLYTAYHDEEWGRPMRDDAQLFGLLMLEGFQAGLSWRTILHKRQHFDQAFHGWDPDVIAAYTDEDIARLMANPGIVRNRLKCEGADCNANAYL